MSRRDRDALDRKSLVLVFIAGSVREAERAEAAAEDFTRGILSSPRTGVGFYVIEGQAPFARHQLAKAEPQSGIIDADT